MTEAHLMERCLVCGSSDIQLMLQLSDANNLQRDIFSCSYCEALLPSFEKRQDNSLKQQVKYHEDFWCGSTTEDLEKAVGELRVFVRATGNLIGPVGTLVTEIGAGRGCLVKALLDEGYKVLACEPSKFLCELAYEKLGICTEVLSTQSAADFLEELSRRQIAPGSVIIWHVLEHMTGATEILRSAANLLAPEGVIFAQVPLPSVEYIYPQHLFFPTKKTIAYWAYTTKTQVIHFGVDARFRYLTFALRREIQPRASLPEFSPAPRPLIERASELVRVFDNVGRKLSPFSADPPFIWP